MTYEPEESSFAVQPGSMTMVVIVALTALTLTLSGLGVIGYVLFTNLET